MPFGQKTSQRIANPPGNPHAKSVAGTMLARQFSRWSIVAGVALIAAAAAFVYLPSIRGGYLLDDEGLLKEAPWVTSNNGLSHIWFSTEVPDYWPLTYSMFWAEWHCWGDHPLGYHVVNLVLHILAALLVWLILHKLKIPGAFLAGLLFAVHPVNVESVAWIAQRKNTLAMVWFLLSIWAFLKSDELKIDQSQRSLFDRWFWFSLLSFILALLSKGSVAILPGILLGLVWWQRKEIVRRDFVRLAPFVVVAVIFVGINIWFQKHSNTIEIRHADIVERTLGAAGTIWFYLYKALWPTDLAFIYPQWHIEKSGFIWWLALAAAVAVTVLLWRQRNNRWGKALLFAWGFFCVALLPVMGFTDVGFMRFSLVADHYQHIAIIAVVALVAAGWGLLYNKATGVLRDLTLVAAGAIVAALAVLAREQSFLYTDAVTSYRAAIEKNPGLWMLHGNLGDALFDAGDIKAAVPELREALRLNPESDDAYFYLAEAMVHDGDYAKAIEYYKKALAIEPDNMKANSHLANLYYQRGQFAEAQATADEAMTLAKQHQAKYLIEKIEQWKTNHPLGQRTSAPGFEVPPPISP
ncbi:MAG TPA: tetratricopeptide repeat protein [Pirellulales bacterium]|jgi:hypothetical protein